LIAAAKRVGCLLDLASVPGSRYTIRTGESEIRLVQKDQMYYKIKNPFAKLHLTIARGSLFETMNHLDIAESLGYISHSDEIEALAIELRKMLFSMIKKFS